MLHWMVLTALASTPSDTPDTPADETSEEDSPTPIIRPDDGRPEDNMLLETERDDVGLRKRVEPVFPDAARDAGLSFGRCEVDVLVGPSGLPGEPAFIDCPEVFQRSAMEALRQWRWHPEEHDEDGTPTRVIIDYRDESPTALLATPDPLSTPMSEFTLIEDPREVCVGAVVLTAAGDVAAKKANRLPGCIFEPSREVLEAPPPGTRRTASFETDRGYALRIRYPSCDRAARKATGKILRSWTWPWDPENRVSYEMTVEVDG